MPVERTSLTTGLGASGFSRTAAVLPALAAIVFGAFLLWGAGFAHSDLIHNAAHDSRHSFAFPCH